MFVAAVLVRGGDSTGAESAGAARGGLRERGVCAEGGRAKYHPLPHRARALRAHVRVHVPPLLLQAGDQPHPPPVGL